jgi:hypothetical protein
MGWLGYKGHFTETVSDPADDDPDTSRPAAPNLVTDVQATHAAVPDVAMTAPVHDNLEASGLLPGEHAADSGYVSADLLVSSGCGASPCSARCWPVPPPRPGPVATPRTCSPSTGTAARPPARTARSAANGRPT